MACCTSGRSRWFSSVPARLLSETALSANTRPSRAMTVMRARARALSSRTAVCNWGVEDSAPDCVRNGCSPYATRLVRASSIWPDWTIFLLIEGANHQFPGDEKPTGQDQQGSDRDLPSDGEGHAERSNSLSLYPRDLTEIIASLSEGSFCLSLRMWTSTVRVVP